MPLTLVFFSVNEDDNRLLADDKLLTEGDRKENERSPGNMRNKILEFIKDKRLKDSKKRTTLRN
jgi:hypothetical protein